VLGGVIGAVLSALAAIALGYFTQVEFDVVFDPSNGAFLGLAFVFGVAVALASGIYPAWTAANEHPVDALRD
jgi:putative ABC transport system permease protein